MGPRVNLLYEALSVCVDPFFVLSQPCTVLVWQLGWGGLFPFEWTSPNDDLKSFAAMKVRFPMPPSSLHALFTRRVLAA